MPIYRRIYLMNRLSHYRLNHGDMLANSAGYLDSA